MLRLRVETPIAVLVALLLLIPAGCSGSEAPLASTHNMRPTAFSRDVTVPPKGAISPKLKLVDPSRFVISTASAVIIGSGLQPEIGQAAGSQAVWLLDRKSSEWRRLPPLPSDASVAAAVAIKDVPYFVAATHCRRIGDDDFECKRPGVFRLIDNGRRWEELALPREFFPMRQSSNYVGVAGRDTLVFSSSGPPFNIIALNTTTRRWSRLPSPVSEYVRPCFTEGEFYALSPQQSVGHNPGSDDYRLDVYVLEGERWIGPESIGRYLGPPPRAFSRSEICSSGRLALSNLTSDRSRAVILHHRNGVIESADTPAFDTGSMQESTLAGIARDGTVTTLSSRGAIQRWPLPAEAHKTFRDLGTAWHRGAGETQDVVDLLIVDDDSSVRVLTVPREP